MIETTSHDNKPQCKGKSSHTTQYRTPKKAHAVRQVREHVVGLTLSQMALTEYPICRLRKDFSALPVKARYHTYSV